MYVIYRYTECEFSMKEIEFLLDHIDQHKATGPDGTNGKNLKEGIGILQRSCI